MQVLKTLVDQIFATSREFVAFEDDVLRKLVTAYLSRGHVLIEGLPGTGKTSAAKLMARLLSRSFKRIQFTSDLLPADLLGAHLYQPKLGELEFVRGPLFADFVFADEVNRAPPRTQSALLEAMEERQITVEGKTFALSPDFFVVATQNPLDLEGTFPLPEAQIDRFLFKLPLTYGTEQQERWIVAASIAGKLPLRVEEVHTVVVDFDALQRELGAVRVDASLADYVVRLVRATRQHPLLQQGSSVRGAIGLLRAARVWAATFGRDYVIPDDVKTLAPAVLVHRVRLTPEAQLNQAGPEALIQELLQSVAFPA